MAFLGGLFGSGPQPSRTEQVPRFTPQQQAMQNQMLSMMGPLMQQMQQPQQKFDFGPVEQQARTQFREQTIPGLAERFTGMGAGGQRSSAFQGALGRAGAGLEENLAGMKSGIGLQQQGMEQQRMQSLLASLLGGGMQPSFESYYTPRTQQSYGILPYLLGGGQQAAMGMLGSMF